MYYTSKNILLFTLTHLSYDTALSSLSWSWFIRRLFHCFCFLIGKWETAENNFALQQSFWHNYAQIFLDKQSDKKKTEQFCCNTTFKSQSGSSQLKLRMPAGDKEHEDINVFASIARGFILCRSVVGCGLPVARSAIYSQPIIEV